MRHKINLKNEQGQSMVEFAIVLPLLVVLLFGIIQFGIAFNNYLALTDAVRAGGRKAAVSRESGDPAGAATAAVRSAAADLDQSILGVSVSSTWEPGEDVVVSASYPYSISLFGMTAMAGNLNSKVTERVE